MTLPLLPRRLFMLVLVAAAVPLPTQTVYRTTNFYAVTGANWREIRQSITAARPWKDGFDGDTRWTVKWQFGTAQGAAGCYCTRISTTTTIATTLPRWTPPTNVFPQMKEQWTRYFTNLAQHEAGHANFGIAAATEIQRQVSQIGAQPDCEQLNRLINERGDAIVNDYREREKEYDRRTQHGNRSASP